MHVTIVKRGFCLWGNRFWYRD